MAKSDTKQEPPKDSCDVQDLAEKMFVKNWQAGPVIQDKEPSAFAAMCFQGAKAFLKVASRIREGQSPEDIISPPIPPENVSSTL